MGEWRRGREVMEKRWRRKGMYLAVVCGVSDFDGTEFGGFG
jgi:hypothetical protein